jgi:hypothetical protein
VQYPQNFSRKLLHKKLLIKEGSMKRIEILMVFIFGIIINLKAFENNLFFEWALGYLYTDKKIKYEASEVIFEYSTVYSASLGWYGKFDNGIGIIGDINATYFYGGELPNGLPEEVAFYKFGFGPAYIWENVMLYGTPNFTIINNSIGLSGTFGIKGFAFLEELGFSAGFGIDTPAYLFEEKVSFEPRISYRISLGFMYNLSRKKQIIQEAERQKLAEIERARKEEVQRQKRLEEERLAYVAMLEEMGLTEEEWQAQEAERRRQEEIRRQQERREQNALSQLIQNVIDAGYNIGEPFSVGDIVLVPYGLFTAIDFSRNGDINSYLVIMKDYSTPSKPFYIETTRLLDSVGPMRIEYIGTAQYLEGRVPRSTLRFREIK